MPNIKVKAIATGYFADKIRNEGDEFEIPDTHPLKAVDENGDTTFSSWFRPNGEPAEAATQKLRDAAEKKAKAAPAPKPAASAAADIIG